MIKEIKSERDYELALSEIEKLIDNDPKPNSLESKKLSLYISLVKEYESKFYTTDTPGPIDAILYRMEQQNLNLEDLTKYIGDLEKVKKVLAGSQALTLSMIRALSKGMKIPLKALIREQRYFDLTMGHIDWDKFPVSIMTKRGWIDEEIVTSLNNDAEAIVQRFLQPLGSPQSILTLYRRTSNLRSDKMINEYALFLWNARIVMQALLSNILSKYKPNIVTKNFIKEVIQLSCLDNGPKSAIEYVENAGIPIIIEPHLPNTYLDGACIITLNGPIIGLTIRYDRLDNFWFCLTHELSHIYLHSSNQEIAFYDDLDESSTVDHYEKEADALASELLIPEDEWNKSIARRLRTPTAAKHLANRLNIHPAIVAGKMRHYYGSYSILDKLIGNKQVRRCFQGIKWK